MILPSNTCCKRVILIKATVIVQKPNFGNIKVIICNYLLDTGMDPESGLRGFSHSPLTEVII